MDFKTLKDINTVKSLATDVWKDICSEVKKIKNVNKENTKKAFDKYFVEYLKTNYVKFDGRVSRRQFWMFTLFSMVISWVLSIIVYILPFLSFLSPLFILAILLPGIGLFIRRLHDINLFGWWILIALIPFIGAIALILLFVIPGDDKANDYGATVK